MDGHQRRQYQYNVYMYDHSISIKYEDDVSNLPKIVEFGKNVTNHKPDKDLCEYVCQLAAGVVGDKMTNETIPFRPKQCRERPYHVTQMS